MATDFQQTDTAADSGALIASCSSNSNNTEKDGRKAENGGTAGSTAETTTIDASAADLNAVWFQIVNMDNYDGAAGDWTTRLNITTANHNVTLDEIHICHVDSAFTLLNTLGSLTGIGAALGSTGVQSHTVNQASAVTISAGDMILVIYAFDESLGMNQSFGWTPDQLITGPGALAADGVVIRTQTLMGVGT